MRRGAFLTAALLLSAESGWALCPMCKQALEGQGPGLLSGFYWSIILLCALPLVLFGTLGWKYRQLKRKADAS